MTLGLTGCLGARGISTERAQPATRPVEIRDSVLSALRFGASLRYLPSSDQRALIERYSSVSEDERSSEEALRLALLYLGVAARPSEAARAEGLLLTVADQVGAYEPDLAALAQLLVDALNALPPTSVSPPVTAPATDTAESEVTRLRRELETERERRARVEAQLEALLQLELNLEDDDPAGDKIDEPE